ncbi:ATP-binding protein [Diaphorobacter aerolatus]|uniref:histidine kinase n=1 Tax=Diaphorobacter aerolatus TaxID=1288495 RepID=A0A7H0GIC3_9BURK|nr:sensor histidine kinase [Diaphorobacter aerolatus]QNP48039.1 sensor histidine kinase [Diaphorobacter aerolatus]
MSEPLDPQASAATAPSSGSLRARLLIASLAWIIAALALTGWGLRNLFKEHVHQQLEARLLLHLNQLSVAVNVGPDGTLAVAMLGGEPLFDKPLSGMYWQVDELEINAQKQPEVKREAVARSRSLWDQALALTRVAESAETGRNYRTTTLSDGEGRTLLAVTRNLQLPETQAPPLRLTVAADQMLTAEPLQHFTSMLVLTLAALAVGLAIAVLIQLQLALRPLQSLRQRLAAVRSGDTRTLEGRFPRELQPLVSEFNKVLNTNAEIVQRARTQAGNLAHAVHTPLTIMSNAAECENTAFAQLVRDQSAVARRQIDHHLARARAASAARATGLRTPVREHLLALLRTMEKLHADRHLQFTLGEVPAQLAFRGEEQDFYELMGNLVDNSGKWARSQVEISARAIDAQRLELNVDDDGPGLSAEQRGLAFQRGVRLDEQRPGSGLGLDIVRDLAQTYGGEITALPSPLGGLRMQLRLPLSSPAKND